MPVDPDVPVNPDPGLDDPMAAAVLAEGSGEFGAADDGDGLMLRDAFLPNPGDVEHGGFPRIVYSQKEIDEMNRQAAAESRPDYVTSQTAGRAAFGEVGKEDGGTNVEPPRDDGLAAQGSGEAAYGEAGLEVGITFVDPPHDGAASQATGSQAVGEAATDDALDTSDEDDAPDGLDAPYAADAFRNPLGMDDGGSAPADGDRDGWGAATDDGAATPATGSATLGDPLGIDDGTGWATDDEGAASAAAGSAATDDPIGAATDDYASDAQAPDSMMDDDFAAPALAESMPVEDMSAPATDDWSAPATDDWSAPAIDDPGTGSDDSAFSDF